MNPDDFKRYPVLQCEMCKEIMTACDFMCSDICPECLEGE